MKNIHDITARHITLHYAMRSRHTTSHRIPSHHKEPHPIRSQLASGVLDMGDGDGDGDGDEDRDED